MNYKYNTIQVETVEEFYQALMQGYLFHNIQAPQEVENQFFSYVKEKEISLFNIRILGDCYSNGYGVEMDEKKGAKLYQKAAKLGDAVAQCNIGLCYADGVGVKQDFTQAAYWFQKAADQGDVLAQEFLGMLYKEGIGVKQDLAQAVFWLQKAAEQGNISAQTNLGIFYYYGVGVDKNLSKAILWFQKAANQGDTNAQYNLGICYENGDGVNQNFSQAVYWFQKVAEQGVADAQFRLGMCYANGNGVKQDFFQASCWLQKAAKQNNTDAQGNLGVCYFNGYGVNKNYSKAVFWFQRAALQGNAHAQYFLGICYENGDGVKQDFSQAIRWYQRAALQGDADAQFRFGSCLYDESGFRQTDISQTIFWYQKAAEQGHADAQFNLGIFYINGIGVEEDDAKAVFWLQKAAEQEHAKAQFNLAFCYKKGRGIKQDFSQAIYWYQRAASQGLEEAKQALEELTPKNQSEAEKEYNISNSGHRHDVFISWNHNDIDFKNTLVKKIESFEREQGNKKIYPHFRAWESDRDGNGLIEECIKNAIEQSKLFILILTENSLKSKWVQLELTYAKEKIKKGIWSYENIIIIRLADDTIQNELNSIKDDNNPFKNISEFNVVFVNEKMDSIGKDNSNDILNRIKNGLEAEAIRRYIQLQQNNTQFRYAIKNQIDSNNSQFTRSIPGNFAMLLDDNNPNNQFKIDISSQAQSKSFFDSYLTLENGYILRKVYDNLNQEIDPEELIHLDSSLYFYGDGGSGKSLLLQSIVKNHFFENGKFFIPLKLSNYRSEIKNKLTLTTIINKELNSYLTEDDEYTPLEPLNRARNGNKNQIVLILDGIDELSVDQQKNLLYLVEKFLKAEPNQKDQLIFLSRSNYYYRDLCNIFASNGKEISLYRLKPFTEEQAKKLYDCIEEKNKDYLIGEDTSLLKEEFFKRLHQLETLQNEKGMIGNDLQKNPFLLSNLIFIWLFNKGTQFPESKYEIIYTSVETILKDLEDYRGSFATFPQKYQPFLQSELEDILSYIAFHKQRGNTKTCKELLIKYVENCLKDITHVEAQKIKDDGAFSIASEI